MARSMLKVVHVSWTNRDSDARTPWEELEEKLHEDAIVAVQAVFTVVEEGPEDPEKKEIHLIAIGEQTF